jgi:hypothetical protein
VSSIAELAELHEIIGGLRRCVTSLRARYGDAPGMRRIALDAERILSDVELLEADASELDLERYSTQYTQEKIAIPDTEYYTEFWRDVDDEGLGGYGRS